MKKTKINFALLGAFFVVLGAYPACSQGTILAGHFGNADPLSEGFTLNRFGSPILGPVVNDSGFDAWSIKMTASDAAQYRQGFSTEQTALINESSWDLSLVLRIIEAPLSPQYDISAEVVTGPGRLRVYFGQNEEGDPTVQIWGSSLSPVITLSGAGSSYNRYQVLYNVESDTAILLVNGQERYNGIILGNLDASLARLSWSGFQHGYDVESHWNEVSFTIIPEPSTFVLFGVGGSVFVALRFFRRKDCASKRTVPKTSRYS